MIDEITKCYFQQFNNPQSKQKSTKSISNKRLLLEAKKIALQMKKDGLTPKNFYNTLIFEQTSSNLAYTVGSNQTALFFTPGQDPMIIGKTTNAQFDGQDVAITVDPSLAASLKKYKSSSDTAAAAEKQDKIGNGIKVGSTWVCNGLVWLLEAPGKLLAWPFKTIAGALSDQKKDSIGPKTINQSAQYAPTVTPPKSIQQAFKKAPQNTMIYNIQTRSWYIKQGNNIKVVPADKITDNPQAMHDAIMNVAGGNYQSGIAMIPPGSSLWQMFFSNKQYQTAARKLKIKDKKQHGYFMANIFFKFMSMFGGGMPAQEYEEYSAAQLRSFSPHINRVVRSGSLPPGTYTFPYKA